MADGAKAARGKGRRSCLACGKVASKSQLARIVRTPDGQVRVDPTGRAPGRGAYVCSAECLSAVRKGRLERALKAKLDQQEYGRIEAELASVLRQAQGIVEE